MLARARRGCEVVSPSVTVEHMPPVDDDRRVRAAGRLAAAGGLRVAGWPMTDRVRDEMAKIHLPP